MASGAEHEVAEVGIMTPQQVLVPSLRAGEVGCSCVAIEDALDARLGDTSHAEEVYTKGKPPRTKSKLSQVVQTIFLWYAAFCFRSM